MKKSGTSKRLSPEESKQLLATLESRFSKHTKRHQGIDWSEVEVKLKANPAKLWSLHQMEKTAGEPDVVGKDEQSGEYLFVDCSAETPKGRTSVCYDREAWESRKEHRPQTNAIDMAATMGVDILTESQYRDLQTLGEFDTKTSSWVTTPADIRKLGGALFGDRRFGQVFIYHNGAQSYYAARAFRGMLKV